MADVKIVDIDSTQWNMKDQNARDRIAALEESFIPQDLADVEITMNVGYTSELAVLRSHYKIGKIHFAIMQINNIKGKDIGTSVTANIGHINIKPKKGTSCLLNDYRNNIVIRSSIANDGTITMDESVGLTQGNNTCLGELIFVEE